jgi:hypothetical protein
VRSFGGIGGAIRQGLEHPALPYVLGLVSALLILPALWAGFPGGRPRTCATRTSAT